VSEGHVDKPHCGSCPQGTVHALYSAGHIPADCGQHYDLSLILHTRSAPTAQGPQSRGGAGQVDSHLHT
jgi:hypothetical protein